jgi:hypothetical protein
MLEDLLDGVVSVNPRKGILLRAILATAETTEGESHKGETIALIMEDVVKLCKPILMSSQSDRSAEFQRDLGDFLLEAVDIWNHVQRIECVVTATSNVDDKASMWGDVNPWHGHDDHEQLGQIEDHMHDEPIKALYPRIYHSLQNDRFLLYAGCALWPDQNLYIAGQREFQVQSTRVSAGTRRLNVSLNTSGDLLFTIYANIKKNSVDTRLKRPSGEKT